MTDQRPTQAGLVEMLWLFFGPAGRISREIYWLAMAAVFSVSFVLGRMWEQTLILETDAEGVVTMMRMTETSSLVLIAMLPLQWSIIVLIAKRARDHGWPGLIALIWMIPFVNLLLTVYIGLAPGNADGGRNDRGSGRPFS